jgi:hypothetical protein
MYQAQAGSQEEMMLEMMRAYLPSELAEALRRAFFHFRAIPDCAACL